MFSVLSYKVEISTSSHGYAEICTYETQYDEGHRHTSALQNVLSALAEMPTFTAALNMTPQF